MSQPPGLPPRAVLLSLFGDSPLGLHLGIRTSHLFNLGSVQRLQPGQTLPNHGGRAVHLVLAGRLSGGGDWWGPGNHFAARGPARQALDADTLVWSLDATQAIWRSTAAQHLRSAWAEALLKVDRSELEARFPDDLPDPKTLCDHGHPTIRQLAQSLERTTPADTADTIFRFVQSMPYRFGLRQELASDTLARGSGVCTSKANLQVALMRVVGIEAGFVEAPLDMGTLGALMPDGWRAQMGDGVKHHFAAARLGGRWHAADASFCDPSCSLFMDAAPHLAAVPVRLQEGHPFHPVAVINGTDPFEIRVLPDLSAEMGKKNRFLPRHFEAMNTRLDRARFKHPVKLRAASTTTVITAPPGESAPA
jgi:hypothetical protein